MKIQPPLRLMVSVSLALALLTLLLALSGTAAGQPASVTVIVTTTNDSGPGSLRQAILDVEPGGTILFAPSLAGGRVVLTSGQLVISRSLTIDASAAVSLTVDGNRVDRVFTIAEDAMVELIALTITGGQAPVNDGGATPHGGGILNFGHLTLTGCRVIDNQAGPGRSSGWDPVSGDTFPAMPGGDGGGIFNTGRLVLGETAVLSNTAGSGGPSVIWPHPGAAGGNGGGIFNSGVLLVTDSTIQVNRAGNGGGAMPDLPPGNGGHGGGLYSTGAMTITRTLIADNKAGDGHTEFGSYSIHFYGSQGGDGGGIYSAASGRFALVDSTVRGNSAGLGDPSQLGRSGGGLYNGGVALVTHSTFTSNRAGESHESLFLSKDGGDGGAIANRGILTLQDSVLNDNATGAGHGGGRGGDGGGLWNRGMATLIDCSVIDNTTNRGSDGVVGSFRVGGTPGGRGGDGAGLWNSANLLLARVTISGNQTGDGGLGGSEWLGVGLAGGRGGAGCGLYNQGVAALINSTVSGNRAGRGGDGGAPQGAHAGGNGGDGGSGGAIHSGYSLTLDNSTVTANVAGAAGLGAQGSPNGAHGIDGAGGGVYGVFAARDTILAGNSAPGVGPDCAGRLFAGGYNLLQIPAGCVIDPVVTNNVLGSSPALLPLALNAPGTTATHALVWGSPAIDAGGCSGGTVAQDQRGVARPQGAGCDIGAYEFDGTVSGRLIWLPHALRRGTP